MRSHEAGALHGDFGHGPSWLHQPVDVNALLPQLWASTVHRDQAGVVTVGGLSVEQIAERFGTPVYVVDEADFRSRLAAYGAAFADRFGPGGVYYAG